VTPKPYRQAQRGATFVELIVSIVVISVGLAGILVVMDRTTRSSGDALVEHQAIAIAEAYLEEILAKPFCDPDGTACAIGNAPGSASCLVCVAKEASRDLYDNVCDYNATNDSPPLKQDGSPPGAGLESYRAQVTVTAAGATLGTGGTPLDGNMCEVLQVQIQVTGPGGTDITLTGYRANY